MLLALSLLAQFASPNVADPDARYHLGHAAVYRERGSRSSPPFPWLTSSADREHRGRPLVRLPPAAAARPRCSRDGSFAAKAAGAALIFAALARSAGACTGSGRGCRCSGPCCPRWRRATSLPADHGAPAQPDARADAPGPLPRRPRRRARPPRSLRARSFTHRLSAGSRCCRRRRDRRARLGGDGIAWARRDGGRRRHPPRRTRTAEPRGRRRNWRDPDRRPGAAQVHRAAGQLRAEFFPPDASQILRQVAADAAVLAADRRSACASGRRRWATPARADDLTLRRHRRRGPGAALRVVSLFVARRGLDLFSAFAVFSAAAAVSLALPAAGPAPGRIAARPAPPPPPWPTAALLSLALLAANTRPSSSATAPGLGAGLPAGPALWLRGASRPGEIVFHTRWEHFATLFFWNRENRYLNGMDPIFQYQLSPALYWKWHCRGGLVRDAHLRQAALPHGRDRGHGDGACAGLRGLVAAARARPEPEAVRPAGARPRVPKFYDDGRHAIYRVPPAR